MEKEKVEATKNLNESIIAIRVELQNAKLKKSGKNKFAGFTYFELADFLPKLNELMLKEGVNDLFTIENEYAELTLIKGSEQNSYRIPFMRFDTPLNKNGTPSMQDIQYLGALNTYYKRYLYLNAFGITDGEIIDSMDNNDLGVDSNKEIKEQIKKYGTKASEKLKEMGKRLSELSKEEMKNLLSELENANI